MFSNVDDEIILFTNDIGFSVSLLANDCKSYHGAYNLTTSDFVDEAKQIMDYYGTRYLWKSLNDETLTDFRKDVLRFCSGGLVGQKVKDYSGMIHSLPYFYHYDTKVAKALSHTKEPKPILAHKLVKLQLNFLDKLRPGKTRQRQKQIHYLFTNSENELILLPFDANSPFRDFFESRCERGPVMIEGFLEDRHFDGRIYHKFRHYWSFVSE